MTWRALGIIKSIEAFKHDIQAILVSNHGGRTLEATVSAQYVIEECRLMYCMR